MDWWIAGVICVLACALLCAVFRYWRTSAGVVAGGILSTIRLLLAVILALTLLQPTCSFQRIRREHPSVVVFFDNSKSMANFNPDSLVLPSISTALEALNKASDNSKTILVCFGDSLRACGSMDTLTYQDSRSFFPEVFGGTVPDTAAVRILVSDGNWTNAEVPTGLFASPDWIYVPFPDAEPPPRLTMEAPVCEPVVSSDSIAVIGIPFHGMLPDSTRLTVSVADGESNLADSTLLVGPGEIDTLVNLRLPQQKPGSRVYRCSVAGNAPWLFDSKFAVQTVIPGTVSSMVYRGVSSLDARFLSLELRRQNTWRSVSAEDNAAPVDILFLFPGDTPVREVVRLCKAEGVVVVFGWHRNDTCAVAAPVSFSLLDRIPPPGIPLFPSVPTPPPPRLLFTCRTPVLRESHTLLSAHYGLRQNGAEFSDTLPIVMLGRLGGRTALWCGVSGFWTWDFSVLQDGYADSSGRFSRALVDYSRELLHRSLSQRFSAIPAGASRTGTAGDSLVWTLSIPRNIASRFDSLSVRMVIEDSLQGVIRDTVLRFQARRFGYPRISCPPLPSGAFRYTMTLGEQGNTVSFTDSLFILPDRSENHVFRQNTFLLEQVATPCAPESLSQCILSRTRRFSGTDVTYPVTLRFPHNRAVLPALILLMCVEWFIRKKRYLD